MSCPICCRKLKLRLKNIQQHLQFATSDRLEIKISVNITNNNMVRGVVLALRIAVTAITEFRCKRRSIPSVLVSILLGTLVVNGLNI